MESLLMELVPICIFHLFQFSVAKRQEEDQQQIWKRTTPDHVGSLFSDFRLQRWERFVFTLIFKLLNISLL